MIKDKHKYSKRYREIAKKLEPKKCYSPNEALQFLKENNPEKSTNIEVAFSFYWNEKKLPLRSQLLLPHPVKKNEKIAIIGEELPTSLQNNSGIELISVEEVSRRVSKGKKASWGFEKLLAHASWQDKIKNLAKILGPKKMFPNSKDGSLSSDLVATVAEIQKGKMEIKTDKHGNLHSLVGKTDFSLEQLEKNYQSLLKAIVNLRPTNWKGDYLRHITFSTTMGPGIKVTI